MMKKITLIFLLASTIQTFAQNETPCTYGVTSESSANAVNVVTGGSIEYAGATDFIVPFGKTFTATQATINILKGDADLSVVNVTFWSEAGGFPDEVITAFNSLVPTSQELAYAIEAGFNAYKITLNFPTAVTLEKGKYFMQISAIPGGEGGAWWEITDGLNQSNGVFDYITFDEGQTWDGSGFGDYVFAVNGTCADSGEEIPDYGDACSQGDTTNNHESGADLFLQKVADDFIVPENTTFHLAHVDFTVLSMGPGINNATVNIRASIDDAPGEIIQSLANIGPSQEQFFDYWPWTGFPPMIPVLKWSFDFDPIALTAGKYFIEVVPNAYFTEALLWEGTSAGTNGGYSYTSFNGVDWIINEGYNQVFNVSGFCENTLGVTTPDKLSFTYAPNPVKDVLNIAASKPIKNIEAYNLMGQKITSFEGAGQSIDMTAFDTGMYLLKVYDTNGGVETMRVLKK